MPERDTALPSDTEKFWEMNNEIEDFRLETLEKGSFIRPRLAVYTQDGEKRRWEILETHDSVAILIWHKERERFVFVRQFRPAVYANGGNGMTVELCAGLVDKKLSLEKIASEEIEEECGYRIEESFLRKINSFHTSVGFAGSRQTLYYAEVDDSMYIGPGGGVDGEKIEVILLDTAEARALMGDDGIVRTPGLLYALEWWFCSRPDMPSRETGQERQ
jgi:UDP-sugar diphosphatase